MKKGTDEMLPLGPTTPAQNAGAEGGGTGDDEAAAHCVTQCTVARFAGPHTDIRSRSASGFHKKFKLFIQIRLKTQNHDQSSTSSDSETRNQYLDFVVVAEFVKSRVGAMGSQPRGTVGFSLEAVGEPNECPSTSRASRQW